MIGLFFLTTLSAQTQKRSCYENNQYYDKAAHQTLESFTKNYSKHNQNIASSRGAITIPVVVHIVYPTEVENISDEQVFSQITALNRDFNRQNLNLTKVHSDFQSRIANVGFNFCLATIDPDGNPTNGITRTSTQSDFVYSRDATWIYHTEDGGKTAWDTNQYLNIWVTKINGFLGFASKPFENSPDEDGVVISAAYIGMCGTALPPFNLGRTGTHEVAHYFNIFHTWGTGNDACSHDDFVADTPSQSDAYSGCPNIDESSCRSRDITANFMNLSEDACLAMFTKGQAMRMQAALIGARSGLLNGNSCEPYFPTVSGEEIKVYPNPASYYFCVEVGNVPLEEIPYFIFNAQGAKVEEGIVQPNSRQHFLSYRNGVYFIQFMDGSKEGVVKKMVISN